MFFFISSMTEGRRGKRKKKNEKLVRRFLIVVKDKYTHINTLKDTNNVMFRGKII